MHGITKECVEGFISREVSSNSTQLLYVYKNPVLLGSTVAGQNVLGGPNLAERNKN